MKKITFLPIALLILFALLNSCKKNSSGTTTGSSSTGNTIYTPPAYSNLYGCFACDKYFTQGTSTSTTNFGCQLAFYSVPKTVIFDTLNTMKINYVKFNGIPMVQDSAGVGGPYYYQDSTPTLYPSNAQWEIGGINPIPSFTLSSFAFPSFSGFASLPDTIHKSQNLVLNLPGIAGADYLRFYVGSGSGNYQSPFYLISSTYTIPSSNLANLSGSIQGEIVIFFSKRIVFPYAGKNYFILLNFSYEKAITVLP